MESTSDMSFAHFVAAVLSLCGLLVLACLVSTAFTWVEQQQARRREARAARYKETVVCQMRCWPWLQQSLRNRAERIAREYPELDRRSA